MNFHHLKLFRTVRSWARSTGLVQFLNRFRNHTGYESRFAALLQEGITPGDVVWDIGANVGYYTLLFAEWTGREGKVVAFEPLPSALQKLSCAVETSSFASRITMVDVALAETPGNAVFVLDASSGSGSSIPTTAHLQESPGISHQDAVHVVVSTVDEIAQQDGIPSPSVTKIDVEGFEEEVLLGGATTFSGAQSRHIFIEVHFARLDERNRGDAPGRIVRLLKSWGYQVRWADPSHLHASRPGA